MHDLSVCLHNTSLQPFAYQPQRLIVDPVRQHRQEQVVVDVLERLHNLIPPSITQNRWSKGLMKDFQLGNFKQVMSEVVAYE